MKKIMTVVAVGILSATHCFGLIELHEVTTDELGQLPLLCFTKTNGEVVTFHLLVRSTSGVLNGTTIGLTRTNELTATDPIPCTNIADVAKLLYATFTVDHNQVASTGLSLSTFYEHRTDYQIPLQRLLDSSIQYDPHIDIRQMPQFRAFLEKQFPFALNRNDRKDSQSGRRGPTDN